MIILAECYGGTVEQDFNAKNTTVLSATIPGQQAYYGGFDEHAAGALRPGPGLTAQSVFDAGSAGSAAHETPTTGGGLLPSDFSLENTSAAGAVQSRQVIFYAGSPDGSGPPENTSDNSQRDVIMSNFTHASPQADNVTFQTAGGAGGGTIGGAGDTGWVNAGSAHGLQQAIIDAGNAIKAFPNAANPTTTKKRFSSSAIMAVCGTWRPI